jgi:hypothetical protein
MSAFTIVAGVSAASSVRGARREALGGRGVVAANNGGAAKKSKGKGRGLALVTRASLVKDDGRPVIIIDNYDSFTYNLSQVRTHPRVSNSTTTVASSGALPVHPIIPEPYLALSTS